MITRREAIQHVTALLGGAALCGGDRLFAFSVDDEALAAALAQGVGTFSAADVELLDEIADTILPATKTPGAKAAGVGPFIAVMVTDTYDPGEQRTFLDGLETLERESRLSNGGGFMASSPAQRVALLERLDRETIEYLRQPGNFDRPHYFRMIKELTLLGYFTSEIGYTQAMRYAETPGRFDPLITYTAGDKAWAPHA
jgi:hypothetical protein